MSLQVLYITVQFPVPSETFAAVEIRALRARGLNISVATLKPAPSGADALLREHKLSDLEIDQNCLTSNLRGLLVALRSPRLLLRLLKALFTKHEEGEVNPDPDGTIARESLKRSLLKDLALIPRSLDLFDKIRQTSPDIVHLFWGHYPSLTGLLVHEFLDDVTVSLSLGAYDLHSRYGPSLELAKKVPSVFTHVRANVPVLESLGVGKDRIHVVYRGIDIDGMTDQTHPKKTLEVLIVERLVAAKRTAESLEVFRLIRDSIPTAQLTIAGDGPERQQLEARVARLGLEGAVTFLGRIGHEETFECYRASKVLLSMSASERLPNTVKEAMLRDCIPVVAHTVGIEELISHGKTGFIVAQGNREQAASAALGCLADWDGNAGLRAAARHHIQKTFDSDAIAQRRSEIWQKAIRD